jgi:ABC-type multidrug transport system ATPase subunit
MFQPAFIASQGMTWVSSNHDMLTAAKAQVKMGTCADVEACCAFIGCTTELFAFSYPGAGLFVVGGAASVLVYTVALALIETRTFPELWARLKGDREVGPHDDDERYSDPLDADVVAEARRVASGSLTEKITVARARKTFTTPSGGCCGSGSTVTRAVDNVSLAIPAGECFGLLGVNGAGKTTLFKMLTGEHSVGSGQILVGGHSVASQLQQVQKRIGYVPQFDALIGYMTGRELLQMYCKIRGVAASFAPALVDGLLRDLNLTRHADKPCETYSGGNKRKLGVAVALVGDPEILLLDEPTTGMDPGSRRFLWNVILRLAQGGRCIVLTTHSMEECEALCTRLTIMVNGKLQCLGSPQHLKDRFGNGYMIKVTAGVSIKATSIDGVVRAVCMAFPECQVEAIHQRTASLKLENDGVELSLAAIFQMLERLKSENGVSDYSCSQTSLEQIFLRFARESSGSGEGGEGE